MTMNHVLQNKLSSTIINDYTGTANNIKLNVIAAVEENMGIGKDNVLPWHLPSEFQYFLNMTSRPRPDIHGNARQNVVIIGRKTWQTMDQLTFKPFPNSINIVLSKNAEIEQEISKFINTIWCTCLKEAIDAIVPIQNHIDQVWVLGGATIYKMAIESKYFYRLYLTFIHRSYDCDSYFPNEIKLHEDFKLMAYEDVRDTRVLKGIQVDKTSQVKFEIKVYQKKDST